MTICYAFGALLQQTYSKKMIISYLQVLWARLDVQMMTNTYICHHLAFTRFVPFSLRKYSGSQPTLAVTHTKRYRARDLIR